MMEMSSCAGTEIDMRKTLYQPMGFTRTIVKVRFGESIFTVYRSLLEQHCEYFQALFQSGMKECMEDEICLQAPSVHGFLVALRVIHDERPMLSADEIVDAIQCAAFLQIELLTEHLIDVINSDNCLLMYHTAATFGLTKLFKSTALFIRDMYADLKEDVKCLPEDLIEYVESLVPSTYVTVGSHSPTIKLLQDFMRTVCYLDEDEKDWKVLTHLPLNASTTMAGVTVLDNKLYIVGGVYDISNKVVDSAMMFLQTLGAHFPALSNLVGHVCLYIIGGEFEKTIMSSVEKYKVSLDTWTMRRLFICLWKPKDSTEIYEYVAYKDEWVLIMTLVQHQSYGHCMVAHRDNLYVMRNRASDDFLRCVMDCPCKCNCYNLTSGQWTTMPGQYENSDSVFTVNRRATVEYGIEENKWMTKKQMTGLSKIGSMWTFLLRLPKQSRMLLQKKDNGVEISSGLSSSASVHCVD
uniref:Kelch repeat and BTB (POZ) domain containing 13 n=1 Tax=Sinocyclocheilus rhinocerous TaxID=307959 RepID=A0A673JKE9_9TELE